MSRRLPITLILFVSSLWFTNKTYSQCDLDTTGLNDLEEGNCGTIEIDIHYTDDTVLGCGVAGNDIASGTAVWMRDAAVSACSDFTALGFRSPYQTELPDFDYYVTDEADGGGGTALWDCIGLDSVILRCDDEPRIRKTTLHEMFHNVQRRYLCDMGDPCGTDIYMGSTFGKWVSEGTARFIQDKLDLDIDLVSGDSSHYWDTVDDYMDNYTGTALADLSYRACLFWNYMCEQMGTTVTEPDYGADFLLNFWENYIDLDTTDSLAVLDQAVAEKGDGRSFEDYFLDFEICNVAKDYDTSGLLHPERYVYVDEQQAGATAYTSIDPANAVLGVTDSNEAVEERAARFYELTIDPVDCTAIGFSGDLDDGTQNAGWALLAIKPNGGAGEAAVLLKGTGASFGGAVLQNPADPYEKLIGVVVGLGAGGAADIDFDYTFAEGDLTPEILSPTTLSPLQTGVPGDGVTAARFIVRVFVDGPVSMKPYPASSVAGLLPGDFQVTVGGTAAEVLAGALIGTDYFLVVESVQGSDGIYAIEVQICDSADTQAASVIFSDVQIDEMISIDVSGSMGDPPGTTKLDAAKIAASLYVDAVGDDDRVGVVSFSGDFTDNENAGPGGVCNDDATVLASLATATAAHRDVCRDKINALNDGGWTSIGDGLLLAQEEFDADPMTARVIVLLSDGQENEAAFWSDTYTCSDASILDPVDDSLVPSDSIVHTIAFGPEADEALMADISTRTGGSNLFVDVTAGSPKAAVIPGNCTLSMANSLAEAYQTQLEEARKLERIETHCGDLPPSSTAPPVTVEFVVREGDLRAGLFFFNWDDPQASVKVDLRDPANTLITSALASIYENATHRVYHIPGILAPGVWKATIRTQKASETGQYLCGLSARSLKGVRFDVISAAVPFAGRELLAGLPVQLVGFLTDVKGVIRGAQVSALVELPDRSVRQIMLYDDGKHMDGQEMDGVYGAMFTTTPFSSGPEQDNDTKPTSGPPPRRGSYPVRLRALGLSNLGNAFVREQVVSFHVNSQPQSQEDSDRDGLPDRWELYYCQSLDAANAKGDHDQDGLSDPGEFQNGTNPCDPDTDNGGELDGSEVKGKRNPLDPKDDKIRRPMDFGRYVQDTHEPLNPAGVCNILRYPSHPSYHQLVIYRRMVPGSFSVLATLDRMPNGSFTVIPNIFIDKAVAAGLVYEYYMNAIGSGGEESAPSRIVQIKATEDALPPDGAIRILDRPTTDQLDVGVVVIGHASPSHVRIGGAPITGKEPLLPFEPAGAGIAIVTITLPVPSKVPGMVKAYAKLYDPTGNESDLLVDSVVYDPSGLPFTPTPTNTRPPTRTPTPTNTFQTGVTPTPTNTFQTGVTPTPTNTFQTGVTPTPTTTLCPDVDKSGKIDANDLLWILRYWQREWPLQR